MNVNTYLLSLAIQAVLKQYKWKEIALFDCPDQERRVCGYFQQDFEVSMRSQSPFPWLNLRQELVNAVNDCWTVRNYNQLQTASEQ